MIYRHPLNWTPIYNRRFCLSWGKAHIFSLKLTGLVRTVVYVDKKHFSVFQVRNSDVFLIQLYRNWLPRYFLFFSSKWCANWRHGTKLIRFYYQNICSQIAWHIWLWYTFLSSPVCSPLINFLPPAQQVSRPWLFATVIVPTLLPPCSFMLYIK